MSAFTEFVLIAIALYLWESTLWLPLRGVALRRKWSGSGWKVLDPRGLMAGKELGMIPLLPLPTDAGIAPCQSPPLVVSEDGGFLMELASGSWVSLNSLTWNDLLDKDHYLVANGTRTRMTSPRWVSFLRGAKNRGASPEMAVRLAWRLALSPGRAQREWRRWKRVSRSLRLYGPVLALGVFAGLPLTYLYLGVYPLLMLVVWLWLLMVVTAAHLWWLGKRAYPDAGSALRMDALLSLVVPFHAMRAFEIASVHAMGTTHPIGLMLSTGDLENPWLCHFIRRVLHPLPASPEEARLSAALKPLLSGALAQKGMRLEDYGTEPDRTDDPESTGYCPRCHGRYLGHVKVCPDCSGIKLLRYQGI